MPRSSSPFSKNSLVPGWQWTENRRGRRASASLCLLRASILALTLAPSGCWAWRSKGVLGTSSHFIEYVGKFCFDYKKGATVEAGNVHIVIDGNLRPAPTPQLPRVTEGPPCWGQCTTNGNMYLMVFDDEEKHWQDARRTWYEHSCDELLHYSSFALPLQLHGAPINRTQWIHEQIRPRFWYFVFVACGVHYLEPVSYEIHARNILQGDQSEFGMDERGAVALQLCSALAFGSLGYCLRALARRSSGAEALRSRPLLRMLILSTIFSATGAILLFLHYVKYSFDGWGIPFLDLLGVTFVCLAKATLSLLQLLVAKGWALFYSPGEAYQRRVVICLLGWIIFMSLACEVHSEFFHDWSADIYMYESWTGTTILVFNLFLFLETWRSMRITYRHETSEEVRVFYVAIAASALIYFLSLPILCIVASKISPWARAKWVARGEFIARLLATLLLCFALKPSRLDAMVNSRLENSQTVLSEDGEDSVDEEQHLNPYDPAGSFSRHAAFYAADRDEDREEDDDDEEAEDRKGDRRQRPKDNFLQDRNDVGDVEEGRQSPLLPQKSKEQQQQYQQDQQKEKPQEPNSGKAGETTAPPAAAVNGHGDDAFLLADEDEEGVPSSSICREDLLQLEPEAQPLTLAD